MTAAHTPGPWTAAPHGDGWHITAHTPIAGNRKMFSRIATAHGMEGADAKLIAACPDLLGALHLALTRLRRMPNKLQQDREAIEIGDTAIAKATQS